MNFQLCEFLLPNGRDGDNGRGGHRRRGGGGRRRKRSDLGRPERRRGIKIAEDHPVVPFVSRRAPVNRHFAIGGGRQCSLEWRAERPVLKFHEPRPVGPRRRYRICARRRERLHKRQDKSRRRSGIFRLDAAEQGACASCDLKTGILNAVADRATPRIRAKRRGDRACPAGTLDNRRRTGRNRRRIMHHLGRLRHDRSAGRLRIHVLDRSAREKLPDAEKENEKKHDDHGDFLSAGFHEIIYNLQFSRSVRGSEARFWRQFSIKIEKLAVNC